MDGYVPPFCYSLFGIVIIVVLLRWIFSGESGGGREYGRVPLGHDANGFPVYSGDKVKAWTYNPDHPANQGRRAATQAMRLNVEGHEGAGGADSGWSEQTVYGLSERNFDILRDAYEAGKDLPMDAVIAIGHREHDRDLHDQWMNGTGQSGERGRPR